MRKIRIVSDGSPSGTKVFDSDGNEIGGEITKIEWTASPELIEARITFVGVDLDVVGVSELDS